MNTDKLEFVPYGDHTILIKIEEENLDIANNNVIQIIRCLEKYKFQSIQEWVPGYNSITVVYDIFQSDFDTLKEKLIDVLSNFKADLIEGRTIKLPICYHPSFSLDMEEIMSLTDLSRNQVIQTHLNTSFKVFMTGFMPGFIYLGELPEILQVPRKASPRLKIPEGSVGIAGKQSGIYSMESPGGWQIIGRSINVLEDLLNGSLKIGIGDSVRFYEVSKDELLLLQGKIITS